MDRSSANFRDANPFYEEGGVFARYLDEPAPPAQEAQARPATKELGYVPLELTAELTPCGALAKIDHFATRPNS